MAMQCQYKLGSVATQLGSNVWVGTTLCFSLILAVCLGPARRKGLRSQELPAAGVARRQELPAAPEKGHAPRADAWRLRQQRETARNLEKAVAASQAMQILAAPHVWYTRTQTRAPRTPCPGRGAALVHARAEA